MSTEIDQSDDSFYKLWQLAPLFIFPALDIIPYIIAGELAYGWGVGAGQMIAVFAIGSLGIYGYRKLIPDMLSRRAWIAVTIIASILALLLWASSYVSGLPVQAGSAFLFSYLFVAVIAYPLGAIRSIVT